MTEPITLLLATLAAFAAGIVNALAGGGTLITFPALTLMGIPPVAANVTNTVALCPGYFGGTLAQINDLRGQGKRLWLIIPVAVIGGIVGGYLLLLSGDKLFNQLIPYLILLASALLAAQDPIRAWLAKRIETGRGVTLESLTWIPVSLASVYGGYFGAGLGVMLVSALGLTLSDSLTRLNALKQATSLAVNVSAAVFFLFSGQVLWTFAIAMAVGALLGGVLGGKLAGRIKPAVLKWTVITIGVVIAFVYFVRG